MARWASRPEDWLLKIEVNIISSRRGGEMTSAAFVIAASLGEAVLAQRSWVACDVGINAAANSLSMMYLGLPMVDLP